MLEKSTKVPFLHKLNSNYKPLIFYLNDETYFNEKIFPSN